MLEWEVLDEEERLPAAGGFRPGRRVLLGWLALLLLLVAAIGGGLWWQTRAQERALRRALGEVVAAEARLLAVGEWEQGRPLLDPDAPLEWKNRYLFYLSGPRALPGVPEIRAVTLDETGTRAEIVVAWPAADAPSPTERRAYRLEEGSWRRTPLYPPSDMVEVERGPHFVLRADPDEWDALQDPAWRFDPAGLRAHLAASWPAAWLETLPITLLLQRQEFGLPAQKTPSRRTLLLNSPRLRYTVGDSPLTSEAWYRLQVTDALILKLLPVQHPAGLAEEQAEQYATLQRQLQWAEARWWALDDAERVALRNAWRDALAGNWLVPFAPTAPAGVAEQQWMTMNLLLDFLVLQRGPAVLGSLATHLHHDPTADPTLIFLRAAGAPLPELFDEARDFARTPE